MGSRGYAKKLVKAAAHLGCSADAERVVEACAKAADNICNDLDPGLTPDDRLEALADRLSVSFDVAKTTEDLDRLVHQHARNGDLGFLARRPKFDAGLIACVLRRDAPAPHEHRFAALIDSREQKRHMEFFSRTHEMAHPMLEPQLELSFREEHAKKTDPWERLVDRAGAAMVFRGEPWTDVITTLPWDTRGPFIGEIEGLRSKLESEASLTALALAAGNTTDHALLVVWASLNASKATKTPALRIRSVTPNICSAVRRTVHIPRNFRVPASSPISTAFRTGAAASGFEDLGVWSSSAGERLPACHVFTSAEARPGGVIAFIDVGTTAGW